MSKNISTYAKEASEQVLKTPYKHGVIGIVMPLFEKFVPPNRWPEETLRTASRSQKQMFKAARATKLELKKMAKKRNLEAIVSPNGLQEISEYLATISVLTENLTEIDLEKRCAIDDFLIGISDVLHKTVEL